MNAAAAAVHSLYLLRDKQKIEAAYRLPKEERLAPRLLGFTPHYKHFLRKKAPKAPATPAAANQPSSSQAAASQPTAGQPVARRSTAGQSRGSSRRRRRMGREEPEDLVGARRPVGRSRDRGRFGASTARQPASPLGQSPTSPTAKRQKTTEETPSGGGSQPNPDVAADVQTAKVIDLDAEIAHNLEREAHDVDQGSGSEQAGPGRRPWGKGSFQTYGGRTITEADSTKEDADVAFGLLRATGLPRDMAGVPSDMEEIITEMGQLTIQVTSLILVLFSLMHIISSVLTNFSSFFAAGQPSFGSR